MPATRSPARDGESSEGDQEKGIGITTAAYLPGAPVVRAFNTMSYRPLRRGRPIGAGERMAIPIAGDDPKAMRGRDPARADAGFDPVAVPLARAQDFAQGGPLYGQQLTAKEMRAEASA